MNFFARQVDEISQKTELKFFAWMITIINLVSACLWSFTDVVSSDLPQLCWSIFGSCGDLPSFLTSYFLWGLIGTTSLTLLFLLAGAFRLAFSLMTLSFLLKLVAYLLNYSFSNNIQALIFMLELFFFFIPLKSVNLKYTILLFHLWSGLSKLNMNWLSGLEIQTYLPHLHIKWIEWIAAMTVIIELVTPFILLSKLKLGFIYAWVAVFLYHIAYAVVAKQVVFAFPALLILYIVIFRHFERKQQREQLYQSYLRPEPSKVWLIVSPALFLLIQWVPGISHPIHFLTETPISFQARNVPSECFSRTFIHYKQALVSLPPLKISSTGNDFKCHESSHKNFSKLCLRYKNSNSDFSKIRKFFYSKKLTDKKYTEVFSLTENCSKYKTEANL